ncbi:MAG: hypothetical protein WEA58_00450 [Balneolaceae bacterium]
MAKSKEYIGISLEDDVIKIARVGYVKKQLEIIRLDKLKLVKPIQKKADQKQLTTDEIFDDSDDSGELDDDLIFGLDDDEGDDADDIFLEEIDLDDMDDDFGIDDDDTDLATEAATPQSNEMLIFDYLESLGKSKKQIALNVPAGDTIFQLLRDGDYDGMKKKELLEYINEKLHAIYGDLHNKDLYDYFIREDGVLVIGSTDEESATLQIVKDAQQEFNRNYFITDTVADESVMVGLFREHYQAIDNEITGLLQISKRKCRLIFMSGDQVLQISPLINEGTDQKNFLNTLFSKILFQLDTGEVPGLDKLIVFNNTVGDKALDFFRTSFSDLKVENFAFNDELLTYNEEIKSVVPSFTTAIGVAAVAAKTDIKKHIQLSFLPTYIADQQKIFKLQWHGVILLLLIGLSPIVLNHFYIEYATEIDSLELQENRIQNSIVEIRPVAEEVGRLTEELGLMQEQLTLLTDLSENNIQWTVTLDTFNRAVQNVGNTWINSFRQNGDVIMIDGYSMYRDRIPQLARQFESVTLLNVQRQQQRERDVFFFTMMIRQVISDESRFSPSYTREFQEMTNQ